MGVATERVEALVEPVVASLGLDLEGVEVQSMGRRRQLRVLVDRDGGVSLDDMADVSRRLSEALDADDVMGELPYVLEVSSPGVDRPLTLPRHWSRAKGHLVEVLFVDGSTLTGRISQVSESSATVAPSSGEPTTVTFGDVSRAVVVVEFRRPDEPSE
jgi:ribosome maturation factor RimP